MWRGTSLLPGMVVPGSHPQRAFRVCGPGYRRAKDVGGVGPCRVRVWEGGVERNSPVKEFRGLLNAPFAQIRGW